MASGPSLHPAFDPTLLAEAAQAEQADRATQRDCALQSRLETLEALGWVLNQKIDGLALAIDRLTCLFGIVR